MEQIFLRDEERAISNRGRGTDIVKHEITLDKYTLMNTTDVKQSFLEKIISEVISHLSVKLQIKIDTHIDFSSQWHKFDHMINELANGFTTRTSMIHKIAYAMLQYLVAVQSIFIKRILNRKLNLDRINIADKS